MRLCFLFGFIFTLSIDFILYFLFEPQTIDETSNGLDFIVLIFETLNRVLRIPLGQFFTIHRFDQRQMDEFGYFCPQYPIEIDMFVGVGEPFLPPHHMRDLHLPIVDYIREVESRPPVLPDHHKVIQRFKLQLPKDLILKIWR